MRDQTLDLFGEVRITTHDIDAWLLAVPRLQPGTARAARYVDEWSVVDKIKRAKLEGRFDLITAPRQPGTGLWWERFSWTQGRQ